jgi:thioesterase domain-containing protein
VVLLETYPPELTAGADGDAVTAELRGALGQDADAGYVRRRLDAYRAQLEAIRGLDADAYDGPVVLVQAAEQDAELREAAAAHWAAHGATPPRRHVVAGDHFSILRPPHVDAVAARVRESLPQP